MSEILKRFTRDMMEIQNETLIISIVFLVFIAVLLIVYWFYNRRKFQELRHEIPAHVVKNYLDSIIQNSNSLKSSLFRGGGLDVSEGIPSVVPVSDLPQSGVQVGGASTEELNQKNAQIAKLNEDLAAKQHLINDLEKRLADLANASGAGEEVAILQSEISNLQARLADKDKQLAEASANAGGGEDAALKQQLAEVTEERDRLKEQLQEYSIIEDDLANVKKLQQENEQLKKELEALKAGGAAPAPVAEPVPEPAPEPEPTPEPEPEPQAVAEPTPAPAEEAIPDEVADSEIDLEAEMAKAIEDSQGGGEAEEAAGDDEPDVPAMDDSDKKSAEELLSEFEKMLG
ncbi:hypothetical protein HBN50_13225 [Halobacteriovorax sp. GB3]|uniref:hypothetical protein n=1 Tax=Halobacteriovorax sp. GB3 TaxID=2719615 RepID=UPI0023617396|nr:hypothetical protein [Halobacteriovorax sp. GB3]MDD0854068.1 hypothetical protein [Halobacteriovorax sp. GB3]